MEADFHYYTIYQLCRLAGFTKTDAQTIAYASQYVDDATESEPIRPFKDQYFDPVRTAHYNLEAFTWNVQKKIYMPFHFLPAAIRWQSPQDFLYLTQTATGAKTELTTRLVEDALLEKNRTFRLIRLGLALHAVADSFSHDGFSGRHHPENNVGKIWFNEKGKWRLQLFQTHADLFVPRIGHLEAYKFPDQPFLNWRYQDGRGKNIVRNNTQICLFGIDLIYRLLKTAVSLKTPPAADLAHDFPDHYQEMKSLFSEKGDLEKRCKRWKVYTGAPAYDRQAWRSRAIYGDVDWDSLSRSRFKAHADTLTGKPGFETSRWAFFHRAAFKQRSLVLGWLN
jgi:hypothetical protein